MNKKLLSLLLLATSVSCVSAQGKKTMTLANDTFPGHGGCYAAPHAVNTPMRTKEEGLYYTNPTGSYYSAARDVDDNGNLLEYPYSYRCYPETRLVVPALAPMTFTRHSRDEEEAEWQWNVYNYEQLRKSGFITSDNSLSLMLPNKRETEEKYDVPILYSGESSFLLGEKNTISYLVISPVMHYLGINDYQTTHMYASMSDGSYMFGTGSIQTSATQSFPCEGVLQFFDKPASPLYVDRFNIACVSKTGFMPADKQLTLTVHNAYIDDNGNWHVGDKQLYTATAGVEDINYEDESNGMSYASIDFSNRNGSLKLIPVAIDQPYCVEITGFNQEGVDVGVRGCDLSVDDASDNVCSTCIMVKDGMETRLLTNTKYKLAMALTMHAMFDNIMVLDEENSEAAYNVIRVSESGTSHFTDGKSESEGLNSVPVYTACPWRDEKNQMNYYWDVDGSNSWVKSVKVDDSQYANSGIYGLMFTCDPLPDGLNGRTATIWLKGKGVKASTPIILLQGNADITAVGKIEATHTSVPSEKTFSLTGQQVGRGYKGIVIKNGKKIMLK